MSVKPSLTILRQELHFRHNEEKPMKILCFGSLNIDYVYKVDHFVQKGETLSSDSLQVFSGGKGLNQSIALARSGVETYHAGSIGEDGKFLLTQLQEAGVNTDYVNVLKTVRTGNAIIQNNKEGDNCILLYGGANQAITTEQVDVVLEHFQDGDFVVLQNEINEVPYIMEQAHNRKMKIVLNPSPMDEMIKKMPLQYVDYFLLNEIEAGQILETDELDGEAMAKALHEKFPKSAIVLTMGEKGSIYLDSNETVQQPVYKVQTVDTTAAGDTFTGFFIGGILKGLTMKETMDLASKAAGIAVTRMGAAPSIPDIQEVIAYI